MPKVFRNLVLGIKTLMLHPTRSILTMLGVLFGVAAVIAMLAVGEGASKQALEQINKLGANNIIITSVKPVQEDASISRRPSGTAYYGLVKADLWALSNSYLYPEVDVIVPIMSARKSARFRDRTIELRVVGTSPQWFDLVSRPVIAGRVFTDSDRADSDVCVLTTTGARKLLAAESVVGQRVLTDGPFSFQVIGVVQNEQSQSGPIDVPDKDVDLYIPIKTFRTLFTETNSRNSAGNFVRENVQLTQLLVRVSSTEQVATVAKNIQTMLERSHTKPDYEIKVPLQLLEQAQKTKRTFNWVLGSIAGISLLVGGIGIMNIMLASVTERTREIGVRRAIGAKRRQIVTQFLIETVVLSTIGGIVGVIVGCVLPWPISHFSGMPTVLPLYGIVMSLAISVAVGIFFGLYPAIRAAHLDPIVALRHE